MCNKSRPIRKTWPEKRITDILESLTRCYRPLPCCKVSIQTAVPTFWQWWQTAMRSSPSSAERGVYSDQLRSEQDIWSEHCQNPLQSSCQPKTTRATAHQSETGLGASVATRENLVWVCECIRKKVCGWHFFSLTASECTWVDKPQSIFNKLRHARSCGLDESRSGIRYIHREHRRRL